MNMKTGKARGLDVPGGHGGHGGSGAPGILGALGVLGTFGTLGTFGALGAMMTLGVLAQPLHAEPAAVSVEVGAVTRGTLEQHVYTDGTAHALRREILQFEREGRVVEIGRDADGGPLREGSAVRGPQGPEPGDLIAVLADGTLAEELIARAARERAMRDRAEAAAATVFSAEERLRSAEAALARTQTLVTQGVLPARNLEEARSTVSSARGDLSRAQAELMAARSDAEAAAAERQGAVATLERGVLRAPFDGVLALLNVREGSHAGPLPGSPSESDRLRMAPAVVIATDAFEIVAEVPWSQAITLHPGQTAQVTWASLDLFADLDRRRAAGESTDALPVAEARIWAVSPTILPDSRTVRIRLRTTGEARALRDGLFVSVRIAAHTLDNVIVVPREAVLHGSGDAFVYVLDHSASQDAAGGTVHRRPVQTGAEARGQVQILHGLSEGEIIVTRGQARLMDGVAVRVIGGKPQS